MVVPKIKGHEDGEPYGSRQKSRIRPILWPAHRASIARYYPCSCAYSGVLGNVRLEPHYAQHLSTCEFANHR